MAYTPTPYRPIYAGSTVRETTCRSCGASIAFIRLTSGKYNPVDPESAAMVTLDKQGIPWVTVGGEVIRAREDENGVIRAYKSHFATCPAAGAHRRKGQK